MAQKLFLFDLDGTLMLSGNAGLRAMEKVFMDLHNLPNAFDGIRPDGKIDPAIFREIISHRGLKLPDLDKAIELLCEKYLEELAVEMPISPNAVLMPGIPQLLERLFAMPDVQLALLTGNLEQGARLKCERFDLNKYFPFGAFGSDHEDRAELVRISAERAAKYLARPVPLDKNIFVIGDTPRDVECGQAYNATTVAVATLNYSADQLKKTGADFVFEDFSDTDRVIKELFS